MVIKEYIKYGMIMGIVTAILNYLFTFEAIFISLIFLSKKNYFHMLETIGYYLALRTIASVCLLLIGQGILGVFKKIGIRNRKVLTRGKVYMIIGGGWGLLFYLFCPYYGMDEFLPQISEYDLSGINVFYEFIYSLFGMVISLIFFMYYCITYETDRVYFEYHAKYDDKNMPVSK